MRGFLSENQAEAFLIENGYIVYYKKSIQSPIDLVCYSPEKEEILLIDVKTACKRKTSYRKDQLMHKSKSEIQKKLGVRFLYVHEDGRCTMDTPHGGKP